MNRILLLSIALAIVATGQDLKLGIIGTDTSHATAFTKILNDATDPEHISGVRVVAAEIANGRQDVKVSCAAVKLQTVQP